MDSAQTQQVLAELETLPLDERAARLEELERTLREALDDD